MNKYDIGDLVILKQGNLFIHRWTGVILDYKHDKGWWGNGYYEVFWTPDFLQGKHISFRQLEVWIEQKEAEVLVSK